MRIFFFGLVFLTTTCLLAQEEKILTLQECIDLAINRNLTIKRNQNNLIAAKSNKRQSLYNFLPDLNAEAGYFVREGSFFDNSSGQFATATTRSSRPEISSNMTIFNAFANHHLLRMRTSEYNASYFILEDSKLVIKASVIRSYLSVLVDIENLRVSTERLQFLENQLERERKRMSVGVGDLETVYNFQSQVATEKLNNVNLENQYQTDLLSLAQLLQLDQKTSLKVQGLDFDNIEILTEFDSYEAVLSEVLNYSFQLKSAIASKEASRAQLSQTRADRYPSIGMGVGKGTQYSSNNIGDVRSQFENLNYSFIGASLQIPIFNGYSTQNRIETSKIALQNAKIAEDQAVLDVTNSTQQDYLALRAAQIAYATAQENFEALNQTFEFMKKRFETGNTDFYSYLESLNNKNQAEAQLISAKYTIVLRKQILDLFRGKSSVGSLVNE